MNDHKANIARRKFFKRSFQRFGRTLQVRFYDDFKFFNFVLFDCAVKIVERNLFDGFRVFKTLEFLPLGGNCPRFFFRLRNLERIARVRHFFHSEYFDRRRRTGRVDTLPQIIEERAHTSGIYTCDKRVALRKRSLLHDD